MDVPLSQSREESPALATRARLSEGAGSVADTVADLLGEFVSATDTARQAVLANDDVAFEAALVRLVETRCRTIEFARARCAGARGTGLTKAG